MLSFWLGALLTIPWTELSAGQSVQPTDETAATEALAPTDVDAGRWQRLVVRLKANGLSMESIHECLAPVKEAAQEGLPSDPVLTRIEEGAAKGVEGNALHAAARQRLSTVHSAATALRQAGYGKRNKLNDQLMKSVTLALESGLSADTLRSVLALGKGRQAEWMRSIIEAGETMRLSGMDETTVGPIMTDFTERNMRRTEIIRASRFAVQQHEAHVEGTRIRKQLWDGTGTGGSWERGQNPPGVVGPDPDTPVRGNGPAGSGTTSGHDIHSSSPGNEPAAPGPGGGGSGSGGSGNSNGSGGQGGGAPIGAGSAGSTPIRRP
jgi:hypothetical protein